MGLALAEVKNKGWKVLVKELGYAEATKFILLYEPGNGDYTKTRKELFKNIHLEEIVSDIKRKRNR